MFQAVACAVIFVSKMILIVFERIISVRIRLWYLLKCDVACAVFTSFTDCSASDKIKQLLLSSNASSLGTCMFWNK